MKKLLTILGASSLIVSTAATVVACTGPKFIEGEVNNSLNNMQGSSATIIKELILSDQFNLSYADVSNKLGTLKAKDVVSDFVGDDFNLSQDSDLSDLTNQYFGDFNLQDINLTGDVNLNGTTGVATDQLWRILQDKLGLNLGDTQNLITAIIGGVLPTVNGFGLTQLVESLLPGLDTTLGNWGQNNKTLIEAISFALKGVFTNPTVVEKFSSMVDSFDIGLNYSDLKVENITSAAMISLSNAIGLILDANYQVDTLTPLEWESTTVVNNLLSTSGQNLGWVLGQMLISDPSTQQIGIMSNDLENNIDRYVTVAGNIIQFLQFIQLQFSLFDETRDYAPVDSQHLFTADETSKEYIQSVLGTGKTIREVTNTVQENVAGSLNLKYLFSIFKAAFGHLNDPDDKNGYGLQKFLTILLVGPQDVDIDHWNQDQSMTSPIARYLAGILDSIVLRFIDVNATNLPNAVGSVLPSTLNGLLLNRFLTTFIERLLNGEKLDEPITNLVDDLFIVLQDILDLTTSIPGFDLGDIANILNQILGYQALIKVGVNLIVSQIPLLSAKNSFQELYAGDPLNIEPFLNSPIFQTIVKQIPASFAPTFDKVVAALNNFIDLKNNFLPNHQALNLKNLLNTPLGQINSDGLIPSSFGDYYLNKSIVGIINDFTDQFKITGTEKLTALASFDFKMSWLSDIFDLIVNYNYLDVPEGYYGQNLISIVLENLDQTSTILGLRADQTIGAGSFFDLIFNKIFQINIDTLVDDDSLYFLSNVIATIFQNLNAPVLDFSDNYKTLFSDNDNFNFDFKDPSMNKTQFLGQEVVVTYHNFKTNVDWTYTFDYTREKVNDVFKINSLKKSQLD